MDTRLTVPGIVDDHPETVGAHSRSTALPAGSWDRFRGALFAYSWIDWDAFANAAEAREFAPSRRPTFPLVKIFRLTTSLNWRAKSREVVFQEFAIEWANERVRLRKG